MLTRCVGDCRSILDLSFAFYESNTRDTYPNLHERYHARTNFSFWLCLWLREWSWRSLFLWSCSPGDYSVHKQQQKATRISLHIRRLKTCLLMKGSWIRMCFWEKKAFCKYTSLHGWPSCSTPNSSSTTHQRQCLNKGSLKHFSLGRCCQIWASRATYIAVLSVLTLLITVAYELIPFLAILKTYANKIYLVMNARIPEFLDVNIVPSKCVGR